MNTRSQTVPARPGPHALRRRVIGGITALVALYGFAAYVVVPLAWRFGTPRHPAMKTIPRRTVTGAGIPGGPVNIALVATERELVSAVLAAKWHPADPLTLRSSMRIAESVVLGTQYVDAPVSNLYLWGRKEDLAFELPVGQDARRRHHVRFWRSRELDESGRPLWIGAASFDTRVGLSHRTGQITHHVGPDLDAERDKLLEDLRRGGGLRNVAWRERFQAELKGRNGAGDPYFTDGRLAIGVIRMGD